MRIITCLLFREFPVSPYMVTKITPCEEIHHQVEVLPILEGGLHVNEETNCLNQYLCRRLLSNCLSFITD